MFKLIGRNFDWVIPAVAILLIVISLATLYTITYVSVGTSIAINQLTYFGIGVGLFMLFVIVDYRRLYPIAIISFIIGILLAVPLLPYFSSHLPFVICEFASCRWIDLGFFRFQTSEVTKLVGILFLARVLSDISQIRWWHATGLLATIVVAAFLISQQPDLGSAIVIFASGLVMLAVSRLPWMFWVVCLLIGLLALPFGLHQLKPYQKKRIEIFLHPELDPTKTGYNVRQAEIAVGSGGLFGQGFGRGSQSQLNFLPVAHTDFIFAGYAEATGFVGSIFLLLLYTVLLARILAIAQKSQDPFGRLVAIGIAAQLGIQIIINIGMNIRLLPVTGVPLPLVSFGGTSVFITLIALGILESIAIRQQTYRFD